MIQAMTINTQQRLFSIRDRRSPLEFYDDCLMGVRLPQPDVVEATLIFYVKHPIYRQTGWGNKRAVLHFSFQCIYTYLFNLLLKVTTLSGALNIQLEC